MEGLDLNDWSRSPDGWRIPTGDDKPWCWARSSGLRRKKRAAFSRGYVLKDAERGTLLRAIRSVARGEVLLDDVVARRVLRHLGDPPTTDEISSDPDIERLTDREVEVLSLIANGSRNFEIAQQLFISERTVGNHISNIFRKRNVEDRSQAIIREASTPRTISAQPLASSFC